jgi:xanthine dehydrogenase small subunit
MRRSIRFVFRGKTSEIADFAPSETLLDWLRLRARATGTKEGCAEGDCGACTVVLARARSGEIEHKAVNACIMLLGQVDGAELITIEDLATRDGLHPVQEAMVAHHGSQCGFCTPGIVMSLFAHYQDALRQGGDAPIAERTAICDRLAGNLCRCTGYRPILDAAAEVCSQPKTDHFAARMQERIAVLQALNDDLDVFAGSDDRFLAAPASEDSLARLCLAHPDAMLVAGATDLGLTITKALAAPAKVIWLGRVKGFDRIEESGVNLSLMAGVTHADAFQSLQALHPDLGEIMRRFGSAQVRASGTVGGNIANGSPIGDLAPCLISLGARIELRHGDNLRELPLEDFFLDYRKQDRSPGEFLRRLVIPRLTDANSFFAFKVSKRFDEDISAVLGAFNFTMKDGEIAKARIAFGGMAATPSRARQAEAAARGARPGDTDVVEAMVAALERDFTPIDDMRASAAYRKIVAGNLLRKSMMEWTGTDKATRISSPGFTHAAE